MHVYVLEQTWAIDGEFFTPEKEVFKSYNKGKDVFMKKMKTILREDVDNDPEAHGYAVDTNIDSADAGEDLFFELYGAGRERVDNTTLELVKTEVIE